MSNLPPLERVRLALRTPGLTPMERVLLAELATHNPDAFNPAQSLLAQWHYGEDTRRTRDYVRKVLRSLEAKGLLRIVPINNASGRQTFDRYEVLLHDVEKASSLPKRVRPARASSDVQEASSDVEKTGPKSKRQLRRKDKKQADVEKTSRPKRRVRIGADPLATYRFLQSIEDRRFAVLRYIEEHGESHPKDVAKALNIGVEDARNACYSLCPFHLAKHGETYSISGRNSA